MLRGSRKPLETLSGWKPNSTLALRFPVLKNGEKSVDVAERDFGAIADFRSLLAFNKKQTLKYDNHF